MTFYPPPQHERNRHDHYATPPALAAALIIGLDRLGIELPAPAFDPCAGGGRLLATLDHLGVGGLGSDRFPEAYPRREWIHEDPIDARDPNEVYEVLGPCRSIVTNPPTKDDQAGKQKPQAPKNELERRYRKNWPAYKQKEPAADIAYACLRLLKMDAIELFALLLPLPFEAAGGSTRLALMRSPFFRARVVCCWRPEWIDGTGGGGQMNHAWFMWARDGVSHASVYVSREDAMGELGMDVSRSRLPKADKPPPGTRSPKVVRQALRKPRLSWSFRWPMTLAPISA
jgi:hypothetical protein